MAETPPENSPHRSTSWRTAAGVFLPGARKSDEKIRRYGLVFALSTGLLAIVGRTMDGMRSDLRSDRAEERKLREEEHKALVTALDALTSAQATQAASVAVLASQMQSQLAVMLDRANVKIVPLRPNTTTIYLGEPGVKRVIPPPPSSSATRDQRER